MKIKLTLCMLLAAVCSAWAQQTVTGKVTDQGDGSGMVGVNVVVKGSTTGTQTDIDGNYSIAVPGDAVLTYSYVGYTTEEVPVNNQSVINVALVTDVQTLTEVVVVGYGVQRKADVTGAISSIKQEDIANRPVSNAEQALQGKAAGVLITTNQGTPGAAPSVRIRGVGTTGNSNPLYVVDGMFVDDIRYLNPGDIQSMDVLKDASSLAIYGVRGANGVIIVTTKSGRGAKASFSYDGYAGLTSITNPIEMANASEYATLTNEAILSNSPGSPPQFDNPTSLGEGTNWFDEILQRGFIQNHQVSASGAGEKTTYSISGSYFSQEGIVKTSDYKRYTLRFNNSYQATDFLKLGNNVSLSYDQTANLPGGIIQSAYMMDPTVPVYNPDGTFAFSQPIRNVNGGANVANPVAQLFYNTNNNYNRGGRIVGNIFGELTFLKNFTFRSSYGVDLNYIKNHTYTPVYDVSPSQRNLNSNLVKSNEFINTWLWENTLTYSKNFNDMHNVTALIGYTAQQTSGEYLFGRRVDVPGYNRDVQYLSLGNPTGQTNSDTGPDENTTDRAFVFTYLSYLFRVNYTLLDRYLLTVSFRRDGSSRFPLNNRFGNFPAVGIGWRISEEPFMENVTLFDNLKLRASYGQLGNTNIPNYAYYARITPNLNAVFGPSQSAQIGATEVNPTTSNLLWEVVTQTDIGLEAAFLNNRLTFEVDYYNRKTTDLILNVRANNSPADILRNAASVVNSGFEFSAGWNNESGALKYGVGANLTTVHNEVLSLGNGGVPIIGGGLGNGRNVTLTNVGLPIGGFYGYEVQGIFQNESDITNSAQPDAKPGDLIYRDVDGNNVIGAEDRVYLGSAIPKVFWGFNSNFAFRGFDLAFDLQGTHGNKIYNGKRAVRFGNENYEKEILNRWTAANPSADHPRVGGLNYEVSDYFIENGSFVRIRNIQLGYTLPKALVERVKLSNVRVYINTLNPFTFTGYSGFTPEIGGDNSLSRGVDLNLVPVYATYTAGLNFGF
jgi:TonB-linked SusC/RagA family outer membrane protein